MRRRLAAWLAVGGLWPAQEAWAMWQKLSDGDLLAQSELIVFGTWLGPAPAEAGAQGLGVIEVSEVLKGPADTRRALVAVPAAGAPRSGSDIGFRVGDRGLWLLRRRPGDRTGPYLADHPQRFVPAASEAARIEALRALLRPR